MLKNVFNAIECNGIIIKIFVFCRVRSQTISLFCYRPNRSMVIFIQEIEDLFHYTQSIA
jgi:hypothetical protein